jgi:hypothetical protein
MFFGQPGGIVHLPVTLVLRGHLQEIAEPGFENLGPVARCVEPSNANTLVPLGEALKVLPNFRITLQGRDHIRWQDELLPHSPLNFFHAGGRHQSGADHSPDALLVCLRELALRAPARAEPLREIIFVDRFHYAVDPAEAERFLDRSL